MSQDKKNNLAQILKDVAISDGFIHEKEIDFMHHIFSEIRIIK